MDYLAAVGPAPIGVGAHVAALAGVRPCLLTLWAAALNSWSTLL